MDVSDYDMHAGARPGLSQSITPGKRIGHPQFFLKYPTAKVKRLVESTHKIRVVVLKFSGVGHGRSKNQLKKSRPSGLQVNTFHCLVSTIICHQAYRAAEQRRNQISLSL